MSHDDDLSRWDDDPLVQALRAPATPAELAGETEALAAFRASGPKRSRRRMARRLGTGAGTLAVAVALSGGVAAAYTHSLPDPMQSVAHGLLGAVGVPAPHPAAHRAVAKATHPHGSHGSGLTPSVTGPATSTSTSSLPSSRATPRPSASVVPVGPAPEPTRSPAVAVEHRSATPTPHPSPTASSPSPIRVFPASLDGTASATRIPAGTGVTLSGRVTSVSGAAVPNRKVVAQARPAGQGLPWAKVGTGRTDGDGDVSVSVPVLNRTTRVRLVAARGVHSKPATVVVVPMLSASLSPDGKKYTVTMASAGLQPGDVLVVSRRLRGRRVVVHRVTVDGSGTAQFVVAVPRKHDVTFRVTARRTASHAAAAATFVATTG